MRARLVGYDGERPPVPGTEPVVPIDPNPDPPLDPDDPSIPDPLTLVLEDGVPFHKLEYLALGYNRFDVMCIGGGGGYGGGQALLEESVDAASWVRYQRSAPFTEPNVIGTGPMMHGVRQTPRGGGGGGGGGLHRIKGRLALLPTSCDVHVGAAGDDGAYPAGGGDGGVSSFGGVICRASGGKGGRAYGDTATSDAAKGGVGNVELPGGGAVAGGVGTWDGVIGQGGGGGGYAPSPGGAGSYSATDPITSGPGGGTELVAVHRDVLTVGATVVESGSTNQASTGTWVTYYSLSPTDTYVPGKGGAGGGARPFLINGETEEEWGSKAGNGEGLVIIRLTYVIT